MKLRFTKKFLTYGIILVLLLVTISPIVVFAADDDYVYVSDSYLDIEVGQRVAIQVGASNATGGYDVAASDGVEVTVLSSEQWLDNSADTIEIKGVSAGNSSVTISFYQFGTYEGEAGKRIYPNPITVGVNVYEPEGGYTPDKGGDDGGTEEQKPAEEETTTADPNADKLKVTVDGAEYTVLKDLASIELPKGFTEADGTYNGEKVKVLTFGKELTLYVLKKNDDGSIIFRTYNEKDKKFEAPKTLVQNKITYYLLDIPADEKAPEGYTAKDLQIGDYTIKGYVADAKNYEDFYYIRALTDGNAAYYSYDTKQGSIQRCVSLDEALNANEIIKQMQDEADKAATKAAKTEKLLKIILLAAAVVIVGLIVALIIVALKKKKNGGGSGPKGFDDFGGPGNNNEFDESKFNIENEISNKTMETQIMDAVDVPEGVSDLDAYEMEIENLVDDVKGTSWKDLGL